MRAVRPAFIVAALAAAGLGLVGIAALRGWLPGERLGVSTPVSVGMPAQQVTGGMSTEYEAPDPVKAPQPKEAPKPVEASRPAATPPKPKS